MIILMMTKGNSILLCTAVIVTLFPLISFFIFSTSSLSAVSLHHSLSLTCLHDVLFSLLSPLSLYTSFLSLYTYHSALYTHCTVFRRLLHPCLLPLISLVLFVTVTSPFSLPSSIFASFFLHSLPPPSLYTSSISGCSPSQTPPFRL